MRIIIAGGGTGGHIFPAISIAEEILCRSNENKILFIGTNKGLEKDLIPKRGYNLELINSGAILGKGILNKLSAILSALHGVYGSFKILKRFKPDLVLGVGGYASGPTLLSAYSMFIPTAICEQNSIPGLTNRIVSKFAKKIFLSFKDTEDFFPSDKSVYTGNPIRKELLNTKTNEKMNTDDDQFKVFVLGGSQGATKLNLTLPEVFNAIGQKVKVFHQTGKKDFENVRKLYKDLGLDVEIHEFIDNISEYYSKSDLIISRAGAGTISEITVTGKPSILVPFPYAAHDHQYHNAKYMQQAGASILVKENDLMKDKLINTLTEILDGDKLRLMADNALKLAKPYAAKEIVDNIYFILEKK